VTRPRRPGLRTGSASLLIPAVLLAACSLSVSPRPAAITGRDWGRAPSVERPPQVAETAAPQVGPHPQHCLCGQADLQGVSVTPGGFVAVGYLDPDIVADAWTSSDGLTWARIADFPAEPGSLAAAVASGASGIVAVGSAGADAAAWFSNDAVHWQRAPEQPTLHAPPQIRMTSVVATPRGFIAAGYVGSLAGAVQPAFWQSADGLGWERASAGDRSDARVAALAVVQGGPHEGRIVAVGATGDAQHATGPAAWFSDDGASWRAADVPGSGPATMNGVAAGPAAGLVAVGNDGDSLSGLSWSSPDGETWSSPATDPSMDNGGSRIQVEAIVWAGAQFVAGGHRNFGTQRGTVVIWTSPDGRAWTRAPESVALGEGKLFGLAARSDRVIAVGSVGAPDYYLPTVWLSPPAR
jgi:hypothetical protein